MKVVVGARKSKLSLKQVEEVLEELRRYTSEVEFEVLAVDTQGDRDLKASLKKMEKSDFFTQEVDTMQLQGKCQVAIHSAKDLPYPLPKGLQLIALTKGKNTCDVLVMREGASLHTLKKQGKVGSSSVRRDAVIQKLRPDLQCEEVRGTIENRLEKLFRGELEGLVVAEAALIRLGLTHLNRMVLPGESALFQGQLAILSRTGDEDMEKLFSPLHTRKKGKVLYTGLSTQHVLSDKEVEHLPLIEIVPRSFDCLEIQRAFVDMAHYTHVIFTSKSGVEVFFDCLKHYGTTRLEGKEIWAVGTVTARRLEEYGLQVSKVAKEETQEGLIHLLALEDLDQAYILLPQSSRARPALAQTLVLRRIRHQLCHLYDTRTKRPRILPDIKTFDEIVFTSPSTVDAFIEIFGQIPKEKKMTTIGPITEHRLKFFLS